MTVKNIEITKQVVDNMPKEHSVHLTSLEGKEVLRVFDNYPSVANSFISTLTNKVTKSLIYSKIFDNPLKSLKKGKLDFGDSIEELFVQMAQVKGFTAHWDSGNSGNSEEADLIRKLVPKVSSMYIQVNVDFKSKTTVMDKQLRKAFLNEGGLSKLVMQIVGSITSACEFKEFNITKTVLNSLVGEAKSISNINDNGECVTQKISCGENAPIKQTPYVVNTNGNILTLSQEIRETVGLMKFPSNKFNLAKELTWSEPNEMVLITTPTVSAKLDTQVLANAFNISHADLITRTILVDELPNGIFKGNSEINDKSPNMLSSIDDITSDTTKKPIAILMSEDLLQIWDTHQGAGTFHNPSGEYTNYFANREGIFATCLYSNIAVFY